MRLTEFAGLIGGIGHDSIPGICDVADNPDFVPFSGSNDRPPEAVAAAQHQAGNADMSGTHDQRGLPMSDDRSTAQQGASVFNNGSGYVRNKETGGGDGSRRGYAGRDAGLGDDLNQPHKPAADPQYTASL